MIARHSIRSLAGGGLALAGLVLAAAILAAGAGSVVAQTIVVPRPKPDPMYLNEVRSEYQLFVIGDSMAGGLSDGLDRLAQDDSRFVLNVRTKDATGFTRPDIYDWPQAIEGILARNEVHIAVVMLGMNDSQDMRIDGKTVSFGSKEWLAAYNEALEAFVTTLMENNVAVYWLGMPAMLNHDNDKAMELVTELQRKRVSEAGIKFIDTRAAFAGPDGGFAESGYDHNGIYGRLRARDGIHFVDRGNDKLADLVLDELRRAVEAADQTVAVRSGNEVEVTELPAFGQEAGDGDALEIEPSIPAYGSEISALPDAAAGERAGSLMPFALETVMSEEEVRARKGDFGPVEAQLQILRRSAARGSAADALFSRGTLPAPKPGRADDFAWSGE